MPAPLPLTPSGDSQPSALDITKATRRRYAGWVLLLGVVLVLTYCLVGLTGALNPVAVKAEAELLCHRVMNDQVVAWNSGNLEGFMAGYWEDEDLTFCSGGTVTKGWQATIDRYRKRYQADGKEMGKLQFDDVQFKVMSGEVVVISGRWKLALSDSNPEGLFTLILRPFKDGWKIVYDHTSIAEPPKKS